MRLIPPHCLFLALAMLVARFALWAVDAGVELHAARVEGNEEYEANRPNPSADCLSSSTCDVTNKNSSMDDRRCSAPPLPRRLRLRTSSSATLSRYYIWLFTEINFAVDP